MSSFLSILCSLDKLVGLRSKFPNATKFLLGIFHRVFWVTGCAFFFLKVVSHGAAIPFPVKGCHYFRKIFSNFYPRKSKNRSGNFLFFFKKPLTAASFLTLSGINVDVYKICSTVPNKIYY